MQYNLYEITMTLKFLLPFFLPFIWNSVAFVPASCFYPTFNACTLHTHALVVCCFTAVAKKLKTNYSYSWQAKWSVALAYFVVTKHGQHSSGCYQNKNTKKPCNWYRFPKCIKNNSLYQHMDDRNIWVIEQKNTKKRKGERAIEKQRHN